jgi:hypothetical protein
MSATRRWRGKRRIACCNESGGWVALGQVQPGEPAAELRPPGRRICEYRQGDSPPVSQATDSHCPGPSRCWQLSTAPADDMNLDRQSGGHDASSNPVLPGPGLVANHRPPVPARRRPAVHREPAPPRARATLRLSRTRAADRHAPRICRAERHLTSGVAGPGICLDLVGLVSRGAGLTAARRLPGGRGARARRALAAAAWPHRRRSR